MQYTSNYNFLLPEGTDVVNPLVDVNPNFSSLDSIVKGVSDHAVDRASCTKTGTTHSVVRTNTSANVFEFTATGDWDTGDSMVVDGTPVSVFLPDGSAPLTGAYIINSEVLAIINGTRVTLYGAQALPVLDASNVNYDNTVSGLAATDVQDAIDELDAAVDSNTSSLTWKYHATATAGLDLPLPADYNELYIIVGRSSNKDSDAGYLYIPKESIPSAGSAFKTCDFQAGYAGGVFSLYSGYLGITNRTSVKLYSMTQVKSNGTTDVTSSSNIWVYYR